MFDGNVLVPPLALVVSVLRCTNALNTQTATRREDSKIRFVLTQNSSASRNFPFLAARKRIHFSDLFLDSITTCQSLLYCSWMIFLRKHNSSLPCCTHTLLEKPKRSCVHTHHHATAPLQSSVMVRSQHAHAVALVRSDPATVTVGYRFPI